MKKIAWLWGLCLVSLAALADPDAPSQNSGQKPLISHYDISLGEQGVNSGYQIGPYVALEGRMGFDVPPSRVAPAPAAEPNSYYSVYFLPQYPISSQFTVYGLVGWSHLQVDQYVPAGARANEDLGLGGGLRFSMGQSSHVFVEYGQKPDNQGRNEQSVSFGLSYHF